MGSIPADSAKAASYISTLSHLMSYDILADKAPQGKELFSVKIEGNSFQPVILKAFESDTVFKRVITSSMNADVQFQGSKGELFNQIFVPGKSLMVTTKKKK